MGKGIYDRLINLDNLDGNKIVLIAPRAWPSSKSFIVKVLDMIKQKRIDYNVLSTLVIEQEKNIKKHKSRFRSNAEKNFRKGEARSLSFLNYRYNNAKIIVNDIINGLKT